ncbi:nuclear export Yrb2 [Lecanosticta acicola]|uniref:Nuclear export Yrb2 n=1 Tax=Lecanosticta acicola TaxID=111012 RepID=A0AAI9EDW7_9PEZI|nr:nuclear export Yrb2 [Lecanosticta acicola]
MTAEKDNGPLSDTEGGEKPVREQLQKAHLGHDKNAPRSDATSAGHHGKNGENGSETSGRGLSRKRSHDDMDDPEETGSTDSKSFAAKRSRSTTRGKNDGDNGQRKISGERPRNGDESLDETAEVPIAANGTVPRPGTPEVTGEKREGSEVETVTSPKTKRSRLLSSTTAVESTLQEENKAGASEDQPDDKHNAAAEEESKIPPTSGFANSSAVSPFGALAGSKSPTEEKQTSSSAFASSGFGALAGASTSGFGAIGKGSGGFGSGGNFATGSKSAPKESDKPGAFGGSLGQRSAFSAAGSGSGFGSSASGFGSLGGPSSGGFGAGIGGTGFSSLGGGGLTSFASGKTAAPLGKPAKPFGAPADDDAEEEEGADEEDKAGAKSSLATEEEKQDERFYAQELETGEEDEVTEFSARAKLYNFAAGPEDPSKKEWRERGLGTLRFNVRKPTAEDEKPKGRLLMRAEGSHRVMLNTPVTKELKFGSPAGEKPQGGYMYFVGTVEGKDGLELLQLKMKQVNALDLWSQIVELQKGM